MRENVLQEDTPITLEEACEIVFRNIITPASLRAEAARGHLTIFRVGRRHFTTIRLAREMQERKCREQSPLPDSGLTKPVRRGPSSTAPSESARVAARASFRALRTSSRTTSRPSTP